MNPKSKTPFLWVHAGDNAHAACAGGKARQRARSGGRLGHAGAGQRCDRDAGEHAVEPPAGRHERGDRRRACVPDL